MAASRSSRASSFMSSEWATSDAARRTAVSAYRVAASRSRVMSAQSAGFTASVLDPVAQGGGQEAFRDDFGDEAGSGQRQFHVQGDVGVLAGGDGHQGDVDVGTFVKSAFGEGAEDNQPSTRFQRELFGGADSPYCGVAPLGQAAGAQFVESR